MPIPEIGPLPEPLAYEPAQTPQRSRPSVWLWLVVALVTLPMLPAAAILALRWIPPPTTAFMLQSPVKPVRHAWVPAARIAPLMGKAVIAAEDQKFFIHRGFDFDSIGEALADNRQRSRRRGASTITQQTAKNLFLWQGGGYFRKGLEAWLTVWLELLWPKERILEVYLNVAEFGPGIYGVEAAARAHFGKSASALSPQEAAQLTAVLPSPRRWSVTNPGPYVQRRTQWILGQMGYRTPAVAEPEEEPPIPDWEDDLESDDPVFGDEPEPLLEEGFEPPADFPQKDAAETDATTELDSAEEHEPIETQPYPESAE